MGVCGLQGSCQQYIMRKHVDDLEEEREELDEVDKEKILSHDSNEMIIVWPNIFKFIILHCLALYGLTFLPSLSWQSWLFLLASYQFSGAGITAGAHRLWSHKTYKAKAPLRLFLAIANSMAGENSIYVWTRDHRTHHNASRGFFFAH